MREAIGCALLAVASFACKSLTPQGAEVRVYQADLKTEDAPTPPLPEACRLLATEGPIQQEEQARHIGDPYRAQRNDTAARGGNVLLVRSYRFVTLKRTECAESQARDCPDSAQNWYRVSFESYACDASALAALAELKPAPEGGLFVWTLNKKEPSGTASAAAPPSSPPAAVPAAPSGGASALKSQVLTLVQEGVGTDVIAAYVRSHRPIPPLTAEEILDWKKAGISEEIIRATFPN